MAFLGTSMRRVAESRLLRAARPGLAALSFLLVVPWAPAETAPDREYQIKAVFLFNFTQFVDWPPRAFPDLQAPLVIGVLGQDPFGPFLDEAVQGEKSHNRPLVIQHYHRLEDIKLCQVLFICRSETDRLETIFASLKGRGVLTVGDSENFARRGGMIRFVTENNRTRLKINLEGARAADLTISSKLLRLAEIVAPGED